MSESAVPGQQGPALAAIRNDGDGRIDALLENVVRTLQRRGARVGGFIQREAPQTADCCAEMHLESIADGRRILISQPLGAGSRGCRLDPRGLAEASGLLLAELDRGMDVLVLNRFGKGEDEGQGFRAVIEQAAHREIPVLTAVRPTYRAAWQAFGGDMAITLEPDIDAILAWCEGAIRERKGGRHAA